MSSSGRPTGRKGRRKAVRKPPPHWRKYLTQAELELPPPAGGAPVGDADDPRDEFDYADPPEFAWWQGRFFVTGLAVACVALAVLAVTSMMNASRDREVGAHCRRTGADPDAAGHQQRAHIAYHAQSSQLVCVSPDLTLAWPEPPQLLELHLAVGYSPFPAFAVIWTRSITAGCWSSNA